MLFFVCELALAQDPNPGDPPQILHSLTVSDNSGSYTVFFGLDKRATAGYDTDSGLSESPDINVPWLPGLEARMRRADGSHTQYDIRFGDGRDQTEMHTLDFQRQTGDNTQPITISWNFPQYVTGVMKDVDTGDVITTMSGSGSQQAPFNLSGTPDETVILEIQYTGIPQDQLPVELTAFDALLEGDVAHLNWETASELNNAGFEVQQNVGGVFQAVGFVQGEGTTDEAKRYSFTTTPLAAGTHTFRLKQIDFDGTSALSDEVSVVVELDVDAELSNAYPNPFNPQTQFTLTIARQQQVTLQVYDMLGRHVQTLYEGALSPGEAHLFTFEASSLPSGRYYIRAVGESFTSSQSVMLLK